VSSSHSTSRQPDVHDRVLAYWALARQEADALHVDERADALVDKETEADVENGVDVEVEVEVKQTKIPSFLLASS